MYFNSIEHIHAFTHGYNGCQYSICPPPLTMKKDSPGPGLQSRGHFLARSWGQKIWETWGQGRQTLPMGAAHPSTIHTNIRFLRFKVTIP